MVAATRRERLPDIPGGRPMPDVTRWGMPRAATVRTATVRAATVIAVVLLALSLTMGTQVAGAGASSASSKAQAKKLLLTLADMPKSWKKEKGSGGSGSSSLPGAAQLASCIGVPASLITSNPPEADSPYYENKGGLLEVQDSVSVFPSAKTAESDYNALANAKTPACMTTLMNGSFKAQILGSAGKGATLGTITVTRADPADFAPGSTGLVMSLPITDQGVSLTAVLTVVYYIKGKLGQQIDFNSYGPTFPASLAESLSATALHRL
jgi:hypothetical protein